MAPPTPPSPSDPLISAVSPTRPWAWTPPSHADTLQLVQVHYYIRHGERTPVRTRMTEANPPIPARWDLCHIGKQFRASVLAEGGRREEIPLRKGVEAVDRRDGSVVKHLDGECLSGELTDLGRLSTFTLGQYLRSIYVDRFQLLPSSMQATSDADKLYVRSTNMSRTMESAQQVLRGLLGSEGGADANGAAYMPKILFRNGPSENLLPNTYSCPTLYKLDAQFSSTVASLLNPSLQQYDPVISPHLGGIAPRVDGHPRLSGVLDTIRAASAHGYAVPEIFTRPEVVETLERAVCSEWFYGYTAPDADDRATYRRLAMGPLLSDLSRRLSQKARNPERDPLQMAIYSTHDTTLAGFLSTLDCFPNRWPAFTSSIGVEMYRDDDDDGDAAASSSSSRIASYFSSAKPARPHYLRFLYNGSPVRVPACAPADKHRKGDDTMCTLDAFNEAVEALQRKDGMGWAEECELGRGKKTSKGSG